MTDDLTSYEGREAFERRITQLLSSGAVEDAWTEITAQMTNYAALAAFVEETPQIDAWDQIAADCLQADESFAKDGGGVASSLVIRLWRDEDTRAVGLDRTFYVGGSPAGEGSSHTWYPGDWGRHVAVTGMQVVTSVGRRRRTTGSDELLLIDCITLVQVHRAIDAALAGYGLPHALAVVVTSHRSGPREPGDPIPLPSVTRHALPPKVMNPVSAAAAIKRRREEDALRFQEMVGTMLAEYRELYRLVRLFPFYRAVSRKKLGGILDGLLHSMCRSQEMPTHDVGWRMSPRAFEALLRTYAAKRKVRDVEATLSTERVDALHAQWLHTALACAFDLPKRPASLFGTTVTWGLTFGGPLVQDRWARLKAFSPEQPTAIDRRSPEPALA